MLLAERRDRAQGALLRSSFDNHVLAVFADRILPVDTAVARRSASLNVPDPRPIRDGLIAATALVHRMVVVTRNVTDFEPTEVPNSRSLVCGENIVDAERRAPAPLPKANAPPIG